MKWKAFFKRQAGNTKYLHDGDVVEAMRRSATPISINYHDARLQVASEARDAAAAGGTMSVPGRPYKLSAPILSALPQYLGRRIFAAIAPASST